MAAGSCALPVRNLVAQTAQAKGEVNLALIGIGSQGRELIRASLLDPRIRIVAICDIWEHARRYGQYYLKSYKFEANAYAGYREMLEKETQLDAVVIASPDCAHAEQTVACLKAGRHVYCETPMSNSLDGAKSMVQCAEETGRLLQIGYQRRSNPKYLHVCEKLLQEAKLTGQITQVNASWVLALKPDQGWPRRQDIPADVLAEHGYSSMQQFRNWRWYQPFSGGLFPNLMAHQVDVTGWFLDATPRSVLASGGAEPADPALWNGNVMAIYHYDCPAGPVQVFCQMLTATHSDGSGSYEYFMGTEGSIRISQNPKLTNVYRAPDAPDWDEWVRRKYLEQAGPKRAGDSGEEPDQEVAETGAVSSYSIPVSLDKPPCYDHLANFVDAIGGNGRLNCPPGTAYRTEIAIHKVTSALRAGQKAEFRKEDFPAS